MSPRKNRKKQQAQQTNVEGKQPQKELPEDSQEVVRSWVEWKSLAIRPFLIATLAFILVLITLDPNGSWGASKLQAPGVTVDESFNLQQGVYLYESSKAYNIGLLDIGAVREVYATPPYLSDHPPLGRFWLGGAHSWFSNWFPQRQTAKGHSFLFNLPAARMGSAIAFAITIFLVGTATSCWFGISAGAIASLSMLLMPRLFAHAHFASLESPLNLAYIAAILALGKYWGSHKTPPSLKVAALTGILLGCTLLTKIQGIFLPFPLAIWAIWHFRTKAILPILAWGITGVITFFLCWQWLWLDPANHLMQYLGRTTGRATLHVYYFGQQYADSQTPWHFSFIMFLITVPVGLHFAGFFALFQKTIPFIKECRGQLILLNAIFPLVLFALPVATYDGTRLFLMTFPLWAIVIGVGGAALIEQLKSKFTLKTTRILVTLFFASQCWGIIQMHPCQLSYYNLLAGGQSGASKIGMEQDYWAASLTQSFLQEVIEVVPEMKLLPCFLQCINFN